MPGFFDALPPTNLNRDPDRIWLESQTIDPMKIRPGWQDWTASTSNITVGGGATVSRYIKMGNLVVARWSFTLAAGSAVGTGPGFTLPVTASSDYLDFEAIGEVALRDINGNIYQGVLRLAGTSRTATTMMAITTASANASQVNITATVPFTWATGDYLMARAQYEAA